MYKCKFCEKEFESVRAYSGHMHIHNGSRRPNRSREEIDKEKEEKEEQKRHKQLRREERHKPKTHVCKFCDKQFENGSSLGGHIVTCKMNPDRDKNVVSRSKAHAGKSLSETQKKRISDGMKKAHEKGIAWNIGKSRWNNEQSYPEKFFEQVINNEFDDTEYEMEYPMGIYSLDFAWPKKNLAIEIDGEQHQRFEEYRERDCRKDKYAEDHGWKILRITWKDMHHNPKEKIKEAYKFIHTGN